MPPRSRALKYDALLALTAAIWGFAFVAQRAGMAFVGPFTYNGIRFGLGTLVLVPFLLHRRSRAAQGPTTAPALSSAWKGSLIAGLVLFAGASLQQGGLVYTSAGKAGFITGLYVVLVPILTFLYRKPTPGPHLAAAFIAASGLYLLSVSEELTIGRGDLLVLAAAFAWAIHVLVIARFAPDIDPLLLAARQFAICSILSLAVSLLFETTTWANVRSAAIPILYGGFLSVGIAYTLQVVAQRHAPPTHAVIILSLEAAFGALGGAWLLHERLTARELVGCALMLNAVIVSQLGGGRRSDLPSTIEGRP
ncbi:MAG: DMT family transporter [Candidatus Eisenbacteria bacterium]|nr:DMT family transporter [Candidatus Eisenbacteria bacterium]